MNEDERMIRNELLDVQFEQAAILTGNDADRYDLATSLWHSAKLKEHVGLTKMEASRDYKAAYSIIKDMGLEIGGMIAPVD